ncbi:hypothetical protein bpmyx0001_43350 [Bacillus pseudomycoides DSM 12442]|nr:hypothetical protein bpmyx0001_43350 [Bacillus pseudomycoides DSM 12442]
MRKHLFQDNKDREETRKIETFLLLYIFVKNKKGRTKNKTLSMNIRQNSINLTKN